MKKIAIILVSLLALSLGQVYAQDFKVAIVNANKVVEKSPQYDVVRKSLETEFKRRNTDLVAKQKQLKKLEDKLARDGAVMSKAEAKRLEQDIRSRRRSIGHTRDEYRDDLNLRRNEEVGKLLRKVSEVVRQVGEEDKIDIIFSDGIVYASKRVDITEKVLQRLRDQFKAPPK